MCTAMCTCTGTSEQPSTFARMLPHTYACVHNYPQMHTCTVHSHQQPLKCHAMSRNAHMDHAHTNALCTRTCTHSHTLTCAHTCHIRAIMCLPCTHAPCMHTQTPYTNTCPAHTNICVCICCLCGGSHAYLLMNTFTTCNTHAQYNTPA